MDRSTYPRAPRVFVALAAGALLLAATIGGATAHVDLTVDDDDAVDVLSQLDDKRTQDATLVVAAEDADEPEDVDAPEAEEVDEPEAEEVDEVEPPGAPEPPEADDDEQGEDADESDDDDADDDDADDDESDEDDDGEDHEDDDAEDDD
jgi:hypothetical protein